VRNVLEKKGIDEMVVAYTSRRRGLAKRVDVNDDTLFYAFVSSLRPKLASYVLGKNFSNVTSAIDDARIAEMSDSAASDTSHLADQMSEMRKNIQKMAERCDAMTLSASVQRGRSKSPAHTVTFREPEITQNTRRNYSYASRGQGRGNYRGSQFRGRGRGMRGKGNFTQPRSFGPSPNFAQYPAQQYANQTAGQATADGGAKCIKSCLVQLTINSRFADRVISDPTVSNATTSPVLNNTVLNGSTTL